ncbi:MAG: hypothetical protein NT027_02445 [Proteobacteria bacterium]|nr:hypothetical protein [Pseudomonadota bacterium]
MNRRKFFGISSTIVILVALAELVLPGIAAAQRDPAHAHGPKVLECHATSDVNLPTEGAVGRTYASYMEIFGLFPANFTPPQSNQTSEAPVSILRYQKVGNVFKTSSITSGTGIIRGVKFPELLILGELVSLSLTSLGSQTEIQLGPISGSARTATYIDREFNHRVSYRCDIVDGVYFR